jgi:hypothetical protein
LEKKNVKKRIQPKRTSQKIHREKDPIPWRYCAVTLLCGAFLVGGFFLAARSHFSSIEFGIRNSTLRKQLQELESEKRRLMWQKETALAPSEIKKAAKKLGLTEMSAMSFASVLPSSSFEKPQALPASAKAPDSTKKLVQKTVDAKPAEKLRKDGESKTAAVAARRETSERLVAQLARR